MNDFRAVLTYPGQEKPNQVFRPSQRAARDWAKLVIEKVPAALRAQASVEIYRSSEALIETIK